MPLPSHHPFVSPPPPRFSTTPTPTHPHPARDLSPTPPEETRLTSEPSAGTPQRSPAPAAFPAALPTQRRGPRPPEGLARFNTAPAAAAEAALLACCGSRRWARRVAAHRPYPTLDTLLAAADEAGHDLSGADLDEALAGEAPPVLPPGTSATARTALDAARTAYGDKFGHAFVIRLDGHRPGEQVDQVLAGIRRRLGHEPDEERAIAAGELRRLARARLSLLLAGPGLR